MQSLRALCDTHGILLIADEVQTGFARTGKLFSMEHHCVKPDMITMAKSLAGGMPLSAVSGRAEVMDAPAPGGLGGTYAGNPLAIAAAHAVLDVIDEEDLCTRAAHLGHHLVEVLNKAKRIVRLLLISGRRVRWWRWNLTIRKPGNLHRNLPARSGACIAGRPVAAELRCIRQRYSLPLSAYHPRSAVP
jgi:acetylornithine/succinyldiaminopimelate/putrescine aminotransferase